MPLVAPYSRRGFVPVPLVVHADRRKAARGAVAAWLLVAACAWLAVAKGEVLGGLGGGLILGAAAIELTRRSLRREPVLVADGAGIRSPAIDVDAPWSEVVALAHVVSTYKQTTHALRISVRDGRAVLRRRSEAVPIGRWNRGTLVAHHRLDVSLDDLDGPPAEIAAAAQERFRLAAAPDSLETAEREGERVVRRRGSAATAA